MLTMYVDNYSVFGEVFDFDAKWAVYEALVTVYNFVQWLLHLV